jgi:hypothetical protein
MQSLVQRTPGLVDGTAGARSNKSLGKISRNVPQCFMLAMSMFILSVDTVWHCGILYAIRLVVIYASVLLSVDYSGPPSVVRRGSLARVCLVRPWSVSITFTWAKIHERATKHWKHFCVKLAWTVEPTVENATDSLGLDAKDDPSSSRWIL